MWCLLFRRYANIAEGFGEALSSTFQPENRSVPEKQTDGRTPQREVSFNYCSN